MTPRPIKFVVQRGERLQRVWYCSGRTFFTSRNPNLAREFESASAAQAMADKLNRDGRKTPWRAVVRAPSREIGRGEMSQ